MKLKHLSDLHLEIQGNEFAQRFISSLDPTGIDVLILGGDVISVKDDWAFERLNQFCNKFKQVLFVAGNHESYGSKISTTRRLLWGFQKETKNFHYLHNESVTIDGQRFLGGTMWFKYFPGIELLYKGLNDFRLIADVRSKYDLEYRAFKKLLKKDLKSSDVVISHHCPTNQCLHPDYAGDPYNHFFIAPEMEEFIVNRQPKAWLFGHTHSKWDIKIGNTRVISNPMGYSPEEVRGGFDPKMEIEL